jgi:hypothetical protein
MELLGVLPEGGTPTNAQLVSCARTLNAMLKHWQTRGTHLFANQKLYLFLQKSDREYTLHRTAASSDEFTASFYATSVDGDVAADVTAVTVDNGAAISDADRIGILNSDNEMHWTTVASGGGTTSIVLTAADETTLLDNTIVYTYTTKASRPRKILHCSVREKPTLDFGFHDSLDGTETQTDVLAGQDYRNLSNKFSDGRVNQVYYDKLDPSATLRVWPEPDVGGRYLVMWCERPLEDMSGVAGTGTENFDLPQEWSWAISTNLAMYLAPKFGVADKTWGRVAALAREALFDAESSDSDEYMKLEPSLDRG